MITNNELPNRHLYLIGATGSGKSTAAKEETKNAKRIAVWDPKNEYESEGFIRVNSAREMLALMRQAPCLKPLRVAYTGTTEKEFLMWCECVLAWGSCVALAEEIASVTSPSKAKAGWLRLINQGRAIGQHGIQVIATTQRPQEADKTIMANAARIRTGILRNADAKSVAAEMDIDPSVLTTLRPLDWIEYRRSDHSVIGGNYKHPRKVVTIKEALHTGDMEA